MQHFEYQQIVSNLLEAEQWATAHRKGTSCRGGTSAEATTRHGQQETRHQEPQDGSRETRHYRVSVYSEYVRY